MIKLFASIFVAATLLFATMSANAQTAPAAASCSNPNQQNPEVVALNKFPQTMKNALGSNTTLAAFSATGISIAGSTTPIARKIAGVILLITIFYAIATAMVANKPFGPILVESALIAGIVAMLLAKYALFINFGVSLAEALNATVGTNLANAIYNMVGTFFIVIGKVWDALLNGYSCLAWYEVPAKIFDYLIGLFFLVIAMCFMLLAFVEMLYVYLLGPVMIAIGAAIGPLFMALIISKVTKPFFDRWLSFMFSAVILQYLALLVLRIMTGVMTSATQIGSGSTSFAIHALAIAIIAHMCAKIFTQIPGIAAGLTGGKTGVVGGQASMLPLTAAAAAVGAVKQAASASGKAAGGKAAGAAATSAAIGSKVASNAVNPK